MLLTDCSSKSLLLSAEANVAGILSKRRPCLRKLQNYAFGHMELKITRTFPQGYTHHDIGLEMYGEKETKWNDIAGLVGTRTPVQVRSHHQKFETRQANEKERASMRQEIVRG